jgi:uncharacterized protein
MNPQERKIIDDLFDKLAQAEQQAGPREPTAEAHIRSRMASLPGAPYLMAQTIVMQQQALETAQARLAALEDEVARRPAGGGFLSGLFGGGSGGGERPAAGAPSLSRRDAGAGSPALAPGFGRTQPGRGGGFLAGAAQTAMGVAGGMLLGSMIGSAFGGGAAHAAQADVPEQPAADEGSDQAGDDGGMDAVDFGDDEI